MAKVRANPAILKWARETLNISIEEVAHSLKRDPSVIASWESGRSQPTYVQLEKLAHTIYRRPVAVFFFPEPPAEVELRESFRTLPEFEIKQLRPSVLKLVRRAKAIQIELGELFPAGPQTSRNIVSAVSVPPKSTASETAGALRDCLEVSLQSQLGWRSREEAFSHWREALESVGVFVFKGAFRQDEISGFCLYDVRFPLIYVNNSLAWSRQIFTLFHELSHLLFRTGGIDKVRDDYVEQLRPADRRVERFCNDLAAALLVPDEDFDRRIEGMVTDEREMTHLADMYSVSREVILRKLFDRGMVSQSDYDRLSSEWIGEARRFRGRSRTGDYYATQRTYFSSRYVDAALGAYYRSTIDIHRLADLLGMKVDTAREFEARL